ncbi:hypothetical protein N7461_008637 [Penicillium sp. DV-2018c]|nr:hypothetical protein N7461_008637 [Penicillium sp. DV-2018c]
MKYPRSILQRAIRQSTAPTQSLRRPAARNVSTVTQPVVPRQSSRWTRRLIYASIFGTLGLGAGKWFDNKVSAPPAPGTLEDQAELHEIQRVFDIGLPIVQELRRDPDYVEKEVYQNFEDEHKTHRLTSGPMAGSRSLGLQVGTSFLSFFGSWGTPIPLDCPALESPNLGIPIYLTFILFDREYFGMRRRKRSLAWSSWGQASKAGQPWSTEAHSGL